MSITDVKHPDLHALEAQWEKWRAVFEGGDCFIDRFLKKFSGRETDPAFLERKEITPSPDFAKASVTEIINSIFSRMSDITREDGSETYQAAMAGLARGVDLRGSSMNTYLGQQVLPELVTMSKVGVFIDLPVVDGITAADSLGVRPYLYTYRAEEIRSWVYRRDFPDEFQMVLLRDHVDECDVDSKLPTGSWERWRFLELIEVDGEIKVQVKFFDSDGEQTNMDGVPLKDAPLEGEYVLDMPFIPFVVLELNDSLLSSVSNHQIALMNLASADVAYSIKANYPRYTEQVDERAHSTYLKGPAGGDDDGTQAFADHTTDADQKGGSTVGVRYGPDMDRPGFIHPSPEPLMASMEKQKQLKEEIRELINLSLSGVKSKMASAESKALDQQGLEAGLSHIALELEHAERRIAEKWAILENTKKIPVISYPHRWSLTSDEDRRKNVDALADLRDKIPSETFHKVISRSMAKMLLNEKIPSKELKKIFDEIDSSSAISADPKEIDNAVINGYLDKVTAAKLRGYPEDTVEKANIEQAERASIIAIAQSSAARGVPDLSVDPGREGEIEKKASRDNTLKIDTSRRVRGEGKQ